MSATNINTATATSATPPTTPKIYWGTGNLSSFMGSSPSTTTESAVLEALQFLKSHNITHIDTAQRYGNGKAEEILGKALNLFLNNSKDNDDNDPKAKPFSFTIDTKWAVPEDRAMTENDIINTAERSVLLFSNNTTTTTSSSSSSPIPPIETFYLHSHPAPQTNFHSLLPAITQLHTQGLFTHFGLSNFTPTQIHETYNLCKLNNWVLPTVYQGMYNAVHRTVETELFPLLRALGMGFRAYSPLAGGFLTKTRKDLTDPATAGRFSAALAGNPGASRYRDTYVTPQMLDALDQWAGIADEEGIGRVELAIRWVVHHSGLDGNRGDGVVLGARGSTQLEETIGWVEQGRLSGRAVEGCERVWDALTSDGKA